MRRNYQFILFGIMLSVTLLFTFFSKGNFIRNYLDNLFLITLVTFSIGLYRFFASHGFFIGIRYSFRRFYRTSNDDIEEEEEELEEETGFVSKILRELISVSIFILLLLFLYGFIDPFTN